MVLAQKIPIRLLVLPNVPEALLAKAPATSGTDSSKTMGRRSDSLERYGLVGHKRVPTQRVPRARLGKPVFPSRDR